MIKILIGLELVFLLAGVSLPLVNIDEFWFFTSEFSIASLIITIFQSGEYILGALILVFCFVIPFTKSFARLINIQSIDNLPLHKFSMIDMFLISFLIFGGKMSYFYEVQLKSGFYFLVIYLLINYLGTILKYRNANPIRFT